MKQGRDQISSWDRARDLLWQIIAMAGGELSGKTRLNKVFYEAHMNSWNDSAKMLTDYPIVRLPHGPGVDNLDVLIEELVEQGRLRVEAQKNGPYLEFVYRLREAPPADPETFRVNAIQKALQETSEFTGKELSQRSHDRSRVWNQRTNGQELDIYADAVEQSEIDEVRRQIEAFRKADLGG